MLALTVPALLFFLCLIPYHFLSSVQLAYFPHALHQAFPDYLNRDWLITQSTTPHPFFTSLVSIFYRHEILPAALYTLYVLQIFLLIIALTFLTRSFTKDNRPLLLVLLLLLYYFCDGLGQSTLFSSIVQPTDMAVPFYLFSIGYLIRGRLAPSCFFLGLSGLFHIHFATNGLIVLILYGLCDGFRKWRLWEITSGLALFLILISPNIIPIIRHFDFNEPAMKPEIFRIFFDFRSPHHYRPSTFELSHVVRVLFPLFFLTVPLPIQRGEAGRRVSVYTGIVVTLCLIAALSTEVFYFPTIARLFLFRLSPFLLVIGLTFLASAICDQMDRKNLAGFFLVTLTFACLFLEKDSRLFIPLSAYLILLWTLWPRVERLFHRPFALKLSLGLILLMPCFLAFISRNRTLECLLNLSLGAILYVLLQWPIKRWIPVFLWTVLILGIPSIALPKGHTFHLPLHHFNPNSSPLAFERDPPLAETLRWIQANTEKDVIFLTPPYLAGLRLLARRAIVVDWHAHPFDARGLKEWKERLETVSQTKSLENWRQWRERGISQAEFLRQGYLTLTVDQILSMAARYDATYFLTEAVHPVRDFLIAGGHTLVFENSSYLLFQIQPSVPHDT